MDTKDKDNQLRESIGIFDSGVGGLSILKAFQKINPGYPLHYFADQFHVPYGPRPIEQIKDFSFAVTRFLISLGAKVVVVACNTASAAALYDLRKAFPDIRFVGMEPAVKPAATSTSTGRVGVLATPATFQGQLYASLVDRFAKDVQIFQHTCPGLVQEIEKGNLQGEETKKILREAVLPMLDQKIDTLVLGCTHYPFVIPALEEITQGEVSIIDPAPAVARQTLKIAAAHLKDQPAIAHNTLITSGEIDPFTKIIQQFGIHTNSTKQAVWNDSDRNLNITQQ